MVNLVHCNVADELTRECQVAAVGSGFASFVGPYLSSVNLCTCKGPILVTFKKSARSRCFVDV